MIDFTIDTEIARPVSDVFAYVTDPAKLPTWQTNTVSATPEGDGTLRLGTRVHEIHRAPGGKKVASVVEVSEYEPDRTLGLRMVEGTLLIHGRIAFSPSGNGTLMRFRVYGRPTGAMRLAEPLLRRALRREFEKHCARLKALLEAAAAPTARATVGSAASA